MNARGIVPLVVAIVGVAVLAWSFVTGIGAALDGSGGGSLGYQIVFLAALVAVIGAVVAAIVSLVRRSHPVLSIVTIVVGLLPLVGVVVLWAVNR